MAMDGSPPVHGYPQRQSPQDFATIDTAGLRRRAGGCARGRAAVDATAPALLLLLLLLSLLLLLLLP